MFTISDWKRRLAKLLAALMLLGMPGMDALLGLTAYALEYDRDIISDADALMAGDILHPGSAISRDDETFGKVTPITNRFWGSNLHIIDYVFVGGRYGDSSGKKAIDMNLPLHEGLETISYYWNGDDDCKFSYVFNNRTCFEVAADGTLNIYYLKEEQARDGGCADYETDEVTKELLQSVVPYDGNGNRTTSWEVVNVETNNDYPIEQTRLTPNYGYVDLSETKEDHYLTYTIITLQGYGAHQHKLVKTKSIGGSQLTVECVQNAGCNLPRRRASVWLQKPSQVTFGDGQSVTLAGSDKLMDILQTPTVTYTKGDVTVDSLDDVTETGVWTCKYSFESPYVELFANETGNSVKVELTTDVKVNPRELYDAGIYLDGFSADNKPILTVKLGEKTLTKDTDYSLTYSDVVKNNKREINVKVKGMGMYAGETETTLLEELSDISEMAGFFKLEEEEALYDPYEPFEPQLYTIEPAEGLTEGTDYVITRPAESMNAGEYAITVTGINKYSGSFTLPYWIMPYPIVGEVWVAFEDPVVEEPVGEGIPVSEEQEEPIGEDTDEIKQFTYTGTAIYPALMQMIWRDLELSEADFEVSYPATPVECGRYACEIVFKGNFTGSIILEYEIVPASLTISVNDATVEAWGDTPEYTFTYDGFVNGETEDVLTTKPKVTCAYPKVDGNNTEYVSINNGNAFTTPINLVENSAEAKNYTITYINSDPPAMLTINDQIPSSPPSGEKVHPNLASLANVRSYTYGDSYIGSDGFDKIVGLTGSFSGTMTFGWRKKSDNATVPLNSTTVPQIPGDYVMTVQYGGDDYWAGETAMFDFTVYPREVTVTGISAVNKPFDGNCTVALDVSKAGISGLLEDDASKLNVASATGKFMSATPGTGKSVRVTKIALGGDMKDYYTVSGESLAILLTADITEIDTFAKLKTLLEGCPDNYRLILTRSYFAQNTDTAIGITAKNVTIDMNGKRITGNSAAGLFTVSGELGLIDSVGGGWLTGAKTAITVENGGEARLYDVGISSNTGATGGGVWVKSGGTLLLAGANITGNTATTNGGGVYVETDGTFVVAGGSVTGNKVGSANNNVYLCANSVITVPVVEGTGIMGNAAIGVTTAAAPTDSAPVTLTSGLSQSVGIAFLKSDNGAYGIGLNASQKEAALKPLHNVNVAQIANGTVTVSTEKAVEGTTVTLDVIPNRGCALVADSLTYSMAGGQPAAIENGKFTMPAGDVTVTATFEARDTIPKIVENVLELDGTLNLYYHLKVPEGFNGEGAKMTFSLSGQTIPFNKATKAGDYYEFPCRVYVYQMADPITATFTYQENGETKTVTDTYSVKEYLDDVLRKDTTTVTANVVNALRNYGYYIQRYLRLFGLSYKEMPKGGNPDVDLDSAIAGSAGNAIDTASTYVDYQKIKNLGILLNINSGTDLKFEFNLVAGVSGPVTAKVGEEDEVVINPKNNAYTVAKKNIAANNLDVPFEFIVNVGNEKAFTTTASVMNYIAIVLSNTDNDDEAKAMAALYEYWVAAKAYSKANSQ